MVRPERAFRSGTGGADRRARSRRGADRDRAQQPAIVPGRLERAQATRGGRGGGAKHLYARFRGDRQLGRAVVAVVLDRKSVVWGKRVSVSVDLGGGRVIKKKK